MFGSDICKNGQCSNLFSTYTCYCRSGFYYDNLRLECMGKKWLLFLVFKLLKQMNWDVTVKVFHLNYIYDNWSPVLCPSNAESFFHDHYSIL